MMAFRTLVSGIVLLTLSGLALAQTPEKAAPPAGVVQSIGDGSVDWSKSEVTARGIGLAPANAETPARARMMAREAAIVVAERNLLKVINGVNVESEQTVENLMLVNDTIKTRVEGLVRGARVLQEKELADGSYEVVVGVKLYGKASVAACVDYNQRISATVLARMPQAPVLPTKPVVKNEEWTGVVIDCRGLHLRPTMEPCVLDKEQNLLYPNCQVPKEFNMAAGLVCYHRTLDDATLQRRVGKHPLVIKAIDAVGGKESKCHPVVSADDAAKLEKAETDCGVLSKFAVGVLID